ncbi:hypothetical protein DRE_00041 [Drechslerella stenobrocha 248]|uniref:Uncharacterized protein n=1 Tax=Drechslerella stenobrocha 248 TaxID=1043628 RepID=W7HX29_9PEZI|nr:hypothetical protein DRE_00041 [Drechslerella stenobrocha 248]
MTRPISEEFYHPYDLRFWSLDDAETLRLADGRLSDHQCRNLVVDVGRDNTFVAWDVEDHQAGALKESWKNIDECPGRPQTRWIAIFDAYEQRAFVNALLEGSGISSRTMASLTSPRGKGNLEIVRKMWHWSSIEYGEQCLVLGINTLHNIAPDQDDSPQGWDRDVGPDKAPAKNSHENWYNSIFKSKTSDNHHGTDQTDGLPLASTPVQITPDARQSSAPRLPVSDSKRHRVSQYAQQKFRRESQRQSQSQDHGLRANKEYTLDHADDIFDNAEDFSGYHYHPRMLRLWIWLIKLNDNTIITLHEPFPPFRPDVATHDKVRNTTSRLRRNMRMILRCLSGAGLPRSQGAFEEYNAEFAMETGALIVRQTSLPQQASGLLFYYLFDDWYSTWGLTVDRAHPYNKKLSTMKNESPQLYHIDELHDIVRRLSSLKRVYQSYELVLSRLLEENQQSLGTPALTRFARLKHRIAYLAIGEIAEIEKEAQGLISLV